MMKIGLVPASAWPYLRKVKPRIRGSGVRIVFGTYPLTEPAVTPLMMDLLRMI